MFLVSTLYQWLHCYYLSIQTYITCIVNYLGALEVAKKIRLIDSLEPNKAN